MTKHSIEKQENNLVKITITVDEKTANDAYNKTLKKIGSNINIAGFRKGKAPANVIEKYVGIERIKIEAIESIFPHEFAKIAQEEKLDLATQPQIEHFEFEKGKDLTITVKAELKPEVNLAPYKDVEVEYEEFKGEDDAMDKELEALQNRFSTLEKVDRASNETDVVVFDFEGSVNGELIEHGSAKNYTLDLAHSNFIPGFAQGLVGHSAGEEFVIDVTFPENYHEPKLKGAPAQFKINLHEVKERKLPELNDELAKKAGKFETLDALKEDIKKYLEDAKNYENERRKSDAIFNKVYDETNIDIQESMIEREVEAVKEETKQNALRQGQDWQKLVDAEGVESVNQKMREEAIKRIKNSLIIEKIAKNENIKIEQGDFLTQIQEIARMYGSSANSIFEEMKKNPSSFAFLSQQIATKKVNELLLSSNKFKTK